MTGSAQTMVDQQPTAPRHYYHEIKWRLLAEAPWLVFTLGLAAILSFWILSSQGQFASSTVLDIAIPGVLVLPMIFLLASGDVDLSCGALAGLVYEIINSLHWQTGPALALLISLLAALAVGLTNGLLVGAGRLKAIYVTFGMSYVLLGISSKLDSFMMTIMPPALRAAARSPLILLPWILLVLACAALLIFTPLGRRPRAGEAEPSGRSRLLSRGLPFVFSSFMAWIAGVLLLVGVGSAAISSTYNFTELALLAALLGGTAYYAGTGFMLSGAAALIAVVLLRQVLALPLGQERVVLGVLMLILLPSAQHYHALVDRLYLRQKKRAQEASGAAGLRSQ